MAAANAEHEEELARLQQIEDQKIAKAKLAKEMAELKATQKAEEAEREAEEAREKELAAEAVANAEHRA